MTGFLLKWQKWMQEMMMGHKEALACKVNNTHAHTHITYIKYPAAIVQ